MQDVLLIILIPAALIVGGLVGFILAARKGREAQARADAAGRIEAELRGQIQQIASARPASMSLEAIGGTADFPAPGVAFMMIVPVGSPDIIFWMIVSISF